MINFPKHECGLYLEHNNCRDYCQTVNEWLIEQEENTTTYDWESQKEKEQSIKTNEIWTLQWYPRTPVSSYSIAAPTLEKLLKWAACQDD